MAIRLLLLLEIFLGGGSQIKLVGQESGGVPGRAPTVQGLWQRLEPRAVHPERFQDLRAMNALTDITDRVASWERRADFDDARFKPITHEGRVYGVPAGEKDAVVAFFQRINDDYHARAEKTEYHDDPIRYDYLRLNCAKTIGLGFRIGAGYQDLEVSSATLFGGRRVVAAANANIPTEMAMKLLEVWNARGYGMDVVFYKKYDGSTYVDPHDEEKAAFKDLPNRFPSVLSRDFRKEQGQYRDLDNLFAMYVLYNLGKYSVRVNDETKLLEVEKSKLPMAYADAAKLASKSARADRDSFRRRLPLRPKGTAFGEGAGS